ANGSGGTTIRSTAGACYGGLDDGTSDAFDNASPDVTAAEHVAGIAAGDAAANFGFSFNAVTNTLAGDTRDDDATAGRTVQGSLRQFIQNANAISGANAMRFVPAEPTDATDGTNNWWRISVTNSLPSIDNPFTTVDGTAYSFIDGTAVLDPNPTMLGTGGTVGVDGLALPQVAGPELELLGDLTVNTGLGVSDEGDNSTVRRLAISQLQFNGLATTGGLANKLTGVLVEENVLGSGPSTFVDPGAGNRQSRSMYAYHTEVSGTIRNNLIGFAETTAFPMTWSAKDLLIEGNEIRGAVTAGLAITYSGSEISGDITARGNLIDGNGDAGLTMYGSYGSNVVENNTITNNGATYQGPGINVWGVGNSLTRNIVTGSDAA
ncbi:MAG: right-handed parallel beta-helix repeat-containing protein, partial [bacterium]|nr:right-handed parallel beta-helix repeat-containing protein [bacterium]